MKKIKIMFVCLGNICRSPMAELLFKDMVKKAGREEEFEIASSATASDNISAATEINFYIVIVTPDHMYLKGVSGKKYTFDKAGVYKIRHCAYDAAGNYTVVEFEITVY